MKRTRIINGLAYFGQGVTDERAFPVSSTSSQIETSVVDMCEDAMRELGKKAMGL